MPDPTPQDVGRAIAHEAIEVCTDTSDHCFECDELAGEINAAIEGERRRWIRAIPRHIDWWADDIVKTPGFNESAPLIKMLRRLKVLRGDDA